MPELKAERVKAFSSLGGKLFSRASSGKDYLLVEHKSIEHTKIYVRAMDYGKNLICCMVPYSRAWNI